MPRIGQGDRRSRIPPAVEARLGRIYWKASAVLFLVIALVCGWVASRIWVGGGGADAWIGFGLVCAVGLGAGGLALSARKKARTGTGLPF